MIDDNLISYLADLAYLKFSDDEKNALKKDLGKILNYMAKISELNTNENLESDYYRENANAFRDDEVYASFDRKLILQNAPVKNDTMFFAPKTVE